MTLLRKACAALLCAGLAAQAPLEAPAAREARMAWWREARFGMFVHWGLYSGLAGTWEGRAVGRRGGMEWLQAKVKADAATYAQRALPLFRPKPGFAKAWARLAKEAGCRYVVFTTKHHEGFALHDSALTDFDAGSRLQRDLVKEIVDALRSEGLRVGFYHSLIDWHHPHYAYRASELLPHPLKGQPYPEGVRDHRVYQAFLKGQVEELLSKYGPVDVLWWDYSATDFQGDTAWRAGELMAMARRLQPGLIMNNRLFRTPEAGFDGMGTEAISRQLDTRYGDFITPEQHVPDAGMPGVDWESCMTQNTTWGYSAHDDAWKGAPELIRHLVDVASKGGNYLLNIGPTADGSIPEPTVAAFRAIGAWMAVNGEAIHGTTASPLGAFPWGRCTAKGRTLYLHVFRWPRDGRLGLPSGVRGLKGARILGGGPLRWRLAAGRVELELPASAPDPVATVLALDLEG